MSEIGSIARPLGHGQTGEQQPRKRCNNRQHGENQYRQQDRIGPRNLDEAGLVALKSYLMESFRVEPRFFRQHPEEAWPVLEVCPADLLDHILQNLPKAGKSTLAKSSVEVYGGVARSIVAADEGLSVSPPTDFDARFIIRSTPNGNGREYDKCRYVVEQFLVEKLRRAAEPGSPLSRADVSIIRNYYFQKQVGLS
jgi:hypothetical protein